MHVYIVPTAYVLLTRKIIETYSVDWSWFRIILYWKREELGYMAAIGFLPAMTWSNGSRRFTLDGYGSDLSEMHMRNPENCVNLAALPKNGLLKAWEVLVDADKGVIGVDIECGSIKLIS